MSLAQKPVNLPLWPEHACLPGPALPPPDVEAAAKARHLVFDLPLRPEPAGGRVYLGMGCFWGAERVFWQQPGVVLTSVGYGGGVTKNPDYSEVCTGRTNHTELVEVIWDPNQTDLLNLLAVFWQSHDPTQGMAQGNDLGTQYRSALYVTNQDDLDLALQSRAAYQTQLSRHGFGHITTEIKLIDQYYLAELYHQQYLVRNPGGYCGLGSCGVPFQANS